MKMSSDLKDACWELALRRIEDRGLDWDDLTSEGRQKLLDKAQTFFKEFPSYIPVYVEIWRERE